MPVAREYARIRLSIAEDEDFEDLSPAAQWLYLRVLLPDPSLNYAGVCDWRPNRLLGKANGIDLTYILSAAAELEQKRYVLFDIATEEALIRTYIRGDELMRNPKMALAVVGGYQTTASKALRAVIVTEVLKDREEHPEYSSWEHDISRAEVSRLLTRKGSDSVPYTNQIEVPITNRITNTDPGADYQSDSVHIPSYLSPNNYHQTPDTLEASQDAPPKSKRGTRLPDSWKPDEDVIRAMRDERPDVDLRLEHRKFIDHFKAKAGKDGVKLDWNATWRNWIRNARATPNMPSAGPNAADAKVADWLALANNQTPHLKAIGND